MSMCLSKNSKYRLNINEVNTSYSLPVAKHNNKNEFQNLQDLDETRESIVMCQLKFGCF